MSAPNVRDSVGKVFEITMTDDLGADLRVTSGGSFTDKDARRLNILIALKLRDSGGRRGFSETTTHLRPMRRRPPA